MKRTLISNNEPQFASHTRTKLRLINGGAFFFLRLPHTHIEMDLPLIGSFPASSQPDEGLAPDLPVAVTLQDIVEGRDPVIEHVLELERK